MSTKKLFFIIISSIAIQMFILSFSLVWFWHVFTPESWGWLTGSQFEGVQLFLLGALAGNVSRSLMYQIHKEQ